MNVLKLAVATFASASAFAPPPGRMLPSRATPPFICSMSSASSWDKNEEPPPVQSSASSWDKNEAPKLRLALNRMNQIKGALHPAQVLSMQVKAARQQEQDDHKNQEISLNSMMNSLKTIYGQDGFEGAEVENILEEYTSAEVEIDLDTCSSLEFLFYTRDDRRRDLEGFLKLIDLRDEIQYPVRCRTYELACLDSTD
eukprot:CAMPEP_0173059806 /NCGR_PEP_ID=MMETSP1102-20130122/2210_1 /TAXON_ID=49646 /ORGANISM="Geminigera sp., Strain Caron Lab Isolate" /LENGTH=197 /DNA_ID=CAMNT_0013925893 /DNA_START=62 /DNA_END=657 /DNA_ORIENTATION=+